MMYKRPDEPRLDPGWPDMRRYLPDSTGSIYRAYLRLYRLSIPVPMKKEKVYREVAIMGKLTRKGSGWDSSGVEVAFADIGANRSILSELTKVVGSGSSFS